MFALSKRGSVSNFPENQIARSNNAVSKMVSKAVLAGSVMLATQLEAKEVDDGAPSLIDDVQTGSLGASDPQHVSEIEHRPHTFEDTKAEVASIGGAIATASNAGTNGTSPAKTFASETGLPRDFVTQSPGVLDPSQQTQEVPFEIQTVERGQTSFNVSTNSSSDTSLVIEGINGINGTDGRDGIDGIDGEDGTNGKDGADGQDGADGNDGTDGINGANGTDGRDGVDGKDGEDGVNGIDGRDGVDGKDGKDGTNGKDGADGQDGADGKDGTDGINGTDGTDGRDGVDGKDGADGVNGIDGRDGSDGTDGQDGTDGRDGSNGADGSDGIDGKDGINGYSTVYLDGSLFEGTDILDILKDAGFDVLEGPFGSMGITFDPARTDELIELLEALDTGDSNEVDTFEVEPEHGTTSTTGTENDDFLSGNEDDNVISAFGGNDHLSGGTGSDTLLGGEGVDTADYRNSEEGVHVDLETREALFGDAEGDILVSIENLAGSSNDDILSGDDGNNRLTGRDGDDILSGGAGNDRLIGGEGADQFIGGEGNRDAADFNLAEEAVGVDLLNGGFMGEADGDTYQGIEFIVGSAYHDILLGNNDNNRINGGDGCDVLNGRDGNDTLIGEAGSDILNGGEGADVFIFGEETGYDIIEDFEAGAGRTDRVQFDHLQFDDFEDILDSMVQTEDGVVLAMDSGTILFQDLDVSDFHADDFILA